MVAANNNNDNNEFQNELQDVASSFDSREKRLIARAHAANFDNKRESQDVAERDSHFDRSQSRTIGKKEKVVIQCLGLGGSVGEMMMIVMMMMMKMTSRKRMTMKSLF